MRLKNVSSIKKLNFIEFIRWLKNLPNGQAARIVSYLMDVLTKASFDDWNLRVEFMRLFVVENVFEIFYGINCVGDSF